ncbi:MAG: hypothetical protein V9G12_10900 [Microthrixaceae bacterium]
MRPAQYLRETLAYAATRRGHDRHDREVATSLTMTADDLDLPPGLELTWLGVAGVSLAYEGTRILIDPYVTRAPVGDLLRRRVVRPDATLLDRFVPTADAILLGHTHFDPRARRPGHRPPRRVHGVRRHLRRPPHGPARSGRPCGDRRTAPGPRGRAVRVPLRPERALQARVGPLGAERR